MPELVDKRSRKGGPDQVVVSEIEPPERGNRIVYDSVVKGFGVRATAKGDRAFILNYRTRGGRERRYTIGGCEEWDVKKAREEAAERKRRIRNEGHDPLEEIEADRAAPTVNDLCDRYIEQHLPRKRLKLDKRGRPLRDKDGQIRHDDVRLMTQWIRPELGRRKVEDVTHGDIYDLHHKIGRRTPIRANRAVALLSKMMSLAIVWKMRSDNPCKGIEKYPEQKRHRYLSPDELVALTKALAGHHDQEAANIVRLLLLTGARSGEVRAARWTDLDLDAGVWVKPGATTKQKTEHRVPLSAPAVKLLTEIRDKSPEGAVWVFPARSDDGPRLEIKKAWRSIALAAGLFTVERKKNAKGKEVEVKRVNCRVHDLRHSFASLLVSGGASLPLIGALLGHVVPSTTARYAHLYDDPLRQAAERVGAVIAGGDEDGAEVVSLPRGRR